MFIFILYKNYMPSYNLYEEYVKEINICLSTILNTANDLIYKTNKYNFIVN